MPGEQILIIDDTPVNLKLTRILLVNEGYKVLIAASAEEALELLRSYHPQLILADIQLPGIDGLEFTRRVKKDERLRDIMVIALTAFAMKGDEQKAVDAGCDGYITKPIDTRSLGARIREYLDRRVGSSNGAVTPTAPSGAPGTTTTGGGGGGASVPAAEMLALRRRFLSEGQERSRQLLLDLDGTFNANDASKVLHNWVGTSGLLGYTAISRLAREVEAVMRERPVNNAQLRESLTNLALAFTSPRDARDAPLSETVVQALSGKRVGLVGLPTNEGQRMVAALERTQSQPAFFTISEPPGSDAAKECDLVVIHVRPETASSAWLNPATTITGNRPMVFVGSRDYLLSLGQQVQGMAREYLMDAWEPEEALVRLSLALSQQGRGASIPLQPAVAAGRAQVVIADDDPTVLALVRTAIENFGMEVHTAADGPAAIEAIRRYKPHAAVLDVNMPSMDGYEVLAAIRADQIPVRVLLLTARQQENDIVRGFTLGADDYVVKPFSPMELVARLKRLLSR